MNLPTLPLGSFNNMSFAPTLAVQNQTPTCPLPNASQHPPKIVCPNLARLRIIVQRHADSTTVVAVVLANDLLAVQLPQARIVVRARGDEVRRVGAERAVPHPALVARQRRLERERRGLAVLAGLLRLVCVDFPDLGRVVRGAGRQLLGVGGEQDARDVLFVGVEVRDGLEVGAVEGLD